MQSPTSTLSPAAARLGRAAALALSLGALAACGGGDGGHAPAAVGTGAAHDAAAGAGAASASDLTTDAGATTGQAGSRRESLAAVAATPANTEDASRLAHQASFGPTEALITEIRNAGSAGWVQAQMARRDSRYTSGQGDAGHKWTGSGDFCNRAGAGANCWRDWLSSEPLAWDFYRNATTKADQLRQRVAFALSQIVVVSSLEVHGTYGLRNYHNALLDNAFGNYRQVLKKVAMSPVMGDYLNHVNNDKAAPNENFARELLQLFAIGTCELNADGSLKGGQCRPTHDNARVRSYAYALTGWTYPRGGATAWGCWPRGTNCRYYGGDMVAAPAFHETSALSLLSGVAVPAGSTPASALEKVLDSLMAHPSMAPFIGRQLVQHLVTSNPSPAYVARVSQAFTSGRYSSGGVTFGAGQRGDLAATVAAVLLDTEARRAGATTGKLREPALMLAGVLRALYGRSDGVPLTAYWGARVGQTVFKPLSVFSFYPPDHPLPGSADLEAPAFAIHSAGAAIDRLNFLTFLLWWDGVAAQADVPGATGTKVNLQPFDASAATPATLVDRLSTLAVGKPLPAAARQEIITAVAAITAGNTPAGWQRERVRQAAYLVFASPDYQVQR